MIFLIGRETKTEEKINDLWKVQEVCDRRFESSICSGAHSLNHYSTCPKNAHFLPSPFIVTLPISSDFQTSVCIQISSEDLYLKHRLLRVHLSLWDSEAETNPGYLYFLTSTGDLNATWVWPCLKLLLYSL